MPDLPGGTVTFLFTDIEGSTRLLLQQGPHYGSLLTEYRALLRALIQTHDGQEVDTQGDSFFGVFRRASDALAAAVAIQRTLAGHAWPEGVRMATRMGLHTGEPQLQQGGYVGLDVPRAARLMAAGHGGQLLLSEATAALVLHDLPADVSLRDLGAHRLKDLPHPERIFQLVIAGLPADFPPLKTLDSRRTNLPSQPTPLIGREREIAMLTDLLRRDDVRLVTLSGPGGTGKTRLGFQVAAKLIDDFAQGVYFVNLAPIRDPTLVVSAVAQILGVIETSDQPLAERLQDYLREKRLLLLLDNFEHLLDAASLVAELLAGCPQLKVLVTSRVPLHLRGEKEIPVSPLALPDLQRLPACDQLTQYAAVELFIERALDVRPDFVITNDNAPAVAEICYRLDGLPLAIELAAARVKFFPPAALLKRLEHRLTLLTSGARDLPTRQQTLRNTIDWSYRLLSAGEQRLFARLGVFAGGCTVEAAEAVCSDQRSDAVPLTPDPWPLTPVLDGLMALVDQSLLKQGAESDDEPRFVMLETIREYALEQLAANGECDLIQQWHALYYLAQVEAATVTRISNGKDATEQVEHEHANLLAALTWSQTSSDAGLTVRLADSLAWFWRGTGEWWQQREWLRTLLARPVAAEAPAIRAARLKLAAELADDAGQTQALLEESLALYKDIGDHASRIQVLTRLANLAYELGDLPRARQLQRETLTLARELRDKEQLASVLDNLGLLAREDGDYSRASALFAESLALWREQGKTGADTLTGMGDLALTQGDAARASALYQEAHELYQESEGRLALAWALRNLGRAAHVQGDDVQARAFLEESLALWREHGWTYGIGCCLDALAGVVGSQGQPERAARLFGAGQALRQAWNKVWSWPVGARIDYERDVAAIRAQLDEATFAAAWAEGQAMSMEQAMAYALSEDDGGAESQQPSQPFNAI